MKSPTILCFHSVISHEIAPFQKYQDIAAKIVRLLNNDLGDEYPRSFYYLKAKIKGGYKYYDGKQWDDPKIIAALEPLDPGGDMKHQENRRKGN